jgi:hypothetical protein
LPSARLVGLEAARDGFAARHPQPGGEHREKRHDRQVIPRMTDRERVHGEQDRDRREQDREL